MLVLHESLIKNTKTNDKTKSKHIKLKIDSTIDKLDKQG